MHDRLADGSPMQSAKLSSHRHLIHIGGHVPPLLGLGAKVLLEIWD